MSSQERERSAKPTAAGFPRIGAVAYVNARPLTWRLARLLPRAEIVLDVPSRLADRLAAGQIDVGLVPSIECFSNPRWSILSDACVACEGPVRSVKLYGRVPASQIRTLALDEGSRTSAALTRILLRERFGLEPRLERLPVGSSLGDSRADAVLLIGDRAMRQPEGSFCFVWDLGLEWSRWTGLPFVFALWIARQGVDGRLSEALAAARDQGVRCLEEIAAHEAPRVGIPQEECLSYLRDHLRFRLGRRQREGLERFGRLAVEHQLVATGAEVVFHHPARS